MEDIYSNTLSENKTDNLGEITELTSSLFSQNSSIFNSYNPETPLLDINDNININNEKDIINEKRKIKLFDIIEEDYL